VDPCGVGKDGTVGLRVCLFLVVQGDPMCASFTIGSFGRGGVVMLVAGAVVVGGVAAGAAAAGAAAAGSTATGLTAVRSVVGGAETREREFDGQGRRYHCSCLVLEAKDDVKAVLLTN